MQELKRILARYHLEPVMLSGEVGGRHLEARIIRPTDPNWTGALVSNGWHRRGNIDEHRLALDLLSLGHLSSLKRRKTERDMPADKIAKELEVIRQERAPDDSVYDQAAKMMGSIPEPAEDVLARLRYPLGAIELPIHREAYVDYRDAVIERTAEIRLAVEDMVTDKRVTGQIFKVVHRDMILASLAIERTKRKALEPLANGARALLANAAQRGGSDLERFDWAKVDELLSDVVVACKRRAFRGLAPPGLDRLQDQGPHKDKIAVLHYIHESFRDRSAYFEAVLREVDVAQCYCVGQAARQLYREIRRLLSRAERRLFAFMFLHRLPMLDTDGHASPLFDSVFWLDPLLEDLANDERIVALVVAVIGFRHDLPGERLALELNQRVKALLEYKRIWLAAVRDREQRQRADRRYRSRLRDGTDVERVPDRSESSGWRSLAESDTSRGAIADLLGRFGVSDRDGIELMYWRDGIKQRQIAEEVGISQQAVSARLRRLFGRLCRKLESEGAGSVGARLPRGKWMPR